jgi:hypothetical protein
MDGQKKSEHMMDRIRDLALGEIHPRDELALLAHVAACEACRDAYNEAGALRSFVDRGVEKLAAGLRGSEPSPQFAARLRARLAAEPAPGRWNLVVSEMWESATRRPLYYVAGTAAVALLIAFAMSSWTRRERSAAPTPIEASTAQIPPAATPSSTAPPATASSNSETGEPPRAADSQLPRAANPEHAPATLASSAPEAHVAASRGPESHPRESHAPALLTTASRPAPHEPEVLVPKDELRAVAQLYEATQSGRVDAEQLSVAQQKTREPVEVKPIEITPLESPAADSEEHSAKGPGLP